jgi:hypothetical protein
LVGLVGRRKTLGGERSGETLGELSAAAVLWRRERRTRGGFYQSTDKSISNQAPSLSVGCLFGPPQSPHRKFVGLVFFCLLVQPSGLF